MGTESYEKITFYVEDPGQLESITAQVEALPELSDGDFLVTTDNSSVEAVHGTFAEYEPAGLPFSSFWLWW